MENREMLAMFNARDERAVSEIQKVYGKRCYQTAQAITGSSEDAEECVNDALLALWNSIPPAQPEVLSAYFLRVVRNLALKKRRDSKAGKRNAGETFPSDVLDDLISEPETDAAMDAEELKDVMNEFLASLKRRDRIIFMRRFWFSEDIPSISAEFGLTEVNVRVCLHRSREKLKKELMKRGITL